MKDEEQKENDNNSNTEYDLESFEKHIKSMLPQGYKIQKHGVSHRDAFDKPDDFQILHQGEYDINNKHLQNLDKIENNKIPVNAKSTWKPASKSSCYHVIARMKMSRKEKLCECSSTDVSSGTAVVVSVAGGKIYAMTAAHTLDDKGGRWGKTKMAWLEFEDKGSSDIKRYSIEKYMIYKH